MSKHDRTEKFTSTTVLEPAPAAPLARPENSSPAEAVAGPRAVNLQAFLARRSEKPDQLAGFLFHARKQGLKKLTMDAWAKELAAFQNKPIG